MSSFEVKVYTVTIEEHPNADSLELAKIGEYRSIVKKGLYQTGDLVVYIPEASILPDWLLKYQNFWDYENNRGTLAGSQGNRVKATKLRSVLSQGLIYPVISLKEGNCVYYQDSQLEEQHLLVLEGDDVAEYLGIIKYEPPIPTHLSGEVCNLFGYTTDYDIENYKKYPDVIQEGEEITLGEKIHGTFCSLGYVPGLDHPEIDEGCYVVNSKGLGSQGLAFKFNDANTNNVYVKIAKVMKSQVKLLVDKFNQPVYVFGEIFGPVQDMRYGYCEPQFRAFDIYVGLPKKGCYLDKPEMIEVCKEVGIKTVPILYQGPFSTKILREYTSGREQVSGREQHLREGVVINVVPERTDNIIGRVILKSVSEEYLTRKTKNATEYQ